MLRELIRAVEYEHFVEQRIRVMTEVQCGVGQTSGVLDANYGVIAIGGSAYLLDTWLGFKKWYRVEPWGGGWRTFPKPEILQG